jgi:hypothetical protein
MTIAEPMNTVEQLTAEYFELVAGKAKSGGSDNQTETRIRDLAKLLGRKHDADQFAAAELWAYRQNIAAIVPLTDPTPAELQAMEQAKRDLRRERSLAVVELEVWRYRCQRMAANGVHEGRSEAINKATELKAAVGTAKQASTAAEAACVNAETTKRIRPLAVQYPALCAVLGLSIETAKASRRK